MAHLSYQFVERLCINNKKEHTPPHTNGFRCLVFLLPFLKSLRCPARLQDYINMPGLFTSYFNGPGLFTSLFQTFTLNLFRSCWRVLGQQLIAVLWIVLVIDSAHTHTHTHIPTHCGRVLLYRHVCMSVGACVYVFTCVYGIPELKMWIISRLAVNGSKLAFFKWFKP